MVIIKRRNAKDADFIIKLSAAVESTQSGVWQAHIGENGENPWSETTDKPLLQCLL